MNDLEKFIELYEGFGIKLKPEKKEDGFVILLDSFMEKSDGYVGFFSDVKFDKDGKFILQGFWE